MPAELASQAAEKRSELVEKVADVDEQLGELFLMEEPIDEGTLRGAIRRATINLQFVPVFMGSAYKNKGVQLLLDGVTDYLPSPRDVQNIALVRSSLSPALSSFGVPLCLVTHCSAI
jgi:elongation factor G